MSEYQNCYAIKWGIENFSCCVQETGEFLRSPFFREESSNNQEWRLKLFPRGVADDAFISFELYSEIPVDGIFNYTISVIDSRGFTHFSKEVGSVSFNNQPSCNRLADFIKRDDLFANRLLLLPDDTLTLQCTIDRPFKQHSIIQNIRCERSSFTWPIANFSSIETNVSNLTYPLKVTFDKAPGLGLIFFLSKISDDDSEVCIKFQKTSKYRERYSRGTGRPNESIHALDNRYRDRGIHIAFKISMIDINRTVIKLLHGKHNFFSNTDAEIFCSPPLLKRSDLVKERSHLLPKDTFTLAFNLQISDGSQITLPNGTKSEYFQSPKPSMNVFSNILCEKLYEGRQFCDVGLKVGNQTLSAHKAVLHSQSPVFQEMLDSDMVDKKTGVINIVDFDADTMNLLLQLLYTGKVDDTLSSERILNLYAAAHKYLVSSFRDVCCRLLIPKITAENVWQVISCALKYEDAALKEASESFISKHPSKSLDQYRDDVAKRLMSLDDATTPQTSSKRRKKKN